MFLLEVEVKVLGKVSIMIGRTFGGLLFAEGTRANNDFDGLFGHEVGIEFRIDIEFAIYIN